MNPIDPLDDPPSSTSDTTAALLRKAMALGVEPAPSVNETPPQPDPDVDWDDRPYNKPGYVCGEPECGCASRRKPRWRVLMGRVTHWFRTQWWHLTGDNPEDGS